MSIIKRPKKKELSQEVQDAITQASFNQTINTGRVKSYDPDYPVFEVPINQKLLCYIPNHVKVEVDGSSHLRMDKFSAHPVRAGKGYDDIRCSNSVVIPELGLDGTCPLCDAMAECWELYNKEYADIGATRGVDINSEEGKALLKDDRRGLVDKRAIKEPVIWYTFPIVVIDCEEKDGVLTTTPKKNADGSISGKVYWYSIRELAYLEKWIAGFDALENGESYGNNPAGLWAILNFTYTPKSGKHDKMGSAKSLKVLFKTMPGYEQVEAYFDQLTESWTPAKAQEVVALDAVRDMDEMVEVTDGLMAATREKLTILKLSTSGAVVPAPTSAVGQSAENTLASFGAEAVPNQPAPAQTAPPVQSVGTIDTENHGVVTE